MSSWLQGNPTLAVTRATAIATGNHSPQASSTGMPRSAEAGCSSQLVTLDLPVLTQGRGHHAATEIQRSPIFMHHRKRYHRDPPDPNTRTGLNLAASIVHVTAMLRRLFNRAPKVAPVAPPPVPAGLPAGRVVWAIGDIHGRLDLLDRLLSAIVESDPVREGTRPVLVFLGDYIDRGANSRGVIDRLTTLADDPAFETHFLKGNHEDKMLEFLDDPTVGAAWCDYGGAQALESFGLKVPVLKHRPEGWASLSSDLAHRLTARQKAFLESLEYSVAIGGYFFAHAGARPGVPLDAQSDHDLMWVRGSFLNSETRFERVVVHGHTPADEPYIDHRRIGIDTRAYDSGVLTAVRLEGLGHSFLQAVAQGEGDIVMRPWSVSVAA